MNYYLGMLICIFVSGVCFGEGDWGYGLLTLVTAWYCSPCREVNEKIKQAVLEATRIDRLDDISQKNEHQENL